MHWNTCKTVPGIIIVFFLKNDAQHPNFFGIRLVGQCGPAQLNRQKLFQLQAHRVDSIHASFSVVKFGLRCHLSGSKAAGVQWG